MREALAALIGSLDGFAVIGEVGCDEQALDLARRSRPRLAIIDQELPGCQYERTVERLQDEGLVDAVIAIGLRADGGMRARAAGARAYVQVGAAPADIQRALLGALATAAPQPLTN